MPQRLFSKIIYIGIFFGIIGVVLGYLKPLKTQVYLIDINQHYRDSVISNINSTQPDIENNSLINANTSGYNTQTPTPKPAGNGNFPSISSLLDKTKTNNIDFNAPNTDKKNDTKAPQTTTVADDTGFTAEGIPSTEEVSKKVLAEEQAKQKEKSTGLWTYIKNIFTFGKKNDVKNKENIKAQTIPVTPTPQKTDESKNVNEKTEKSNTKQEPKNKDTSEDDIKIPSVEFLSKEILDLDKKNQ